MFGRTKRPEGHATSRKSAIPSVIASDMNVLGNIISDGVLDIDGRIEGNVRCHTVNIRANGMIRGDLMAEHVVVNGTVEGLIKAKVVTIYASARITGTIMHESLTIEDGAYVDGKMKRTDKLFLEAPEIARAPSLDSEESDEEPTEHELIVLENLRLVR